MNTPLYKADENTVTSLQTFTVDLNNNVELEEKKLTKNQKRVTN